MEGLIAYQVGNKFVTKGHTINDKGQKLIVENEYDAEELIRFIAKNNEHLDTLEEELIGFRRDLRTIKRLESAAKRLREDELKRAKADRKRLS